MSDAKSLGADYFDELYARNRDPWDFETSGYEDAKYAATVASLGGRRSARGLEVGCSIGVLTRRLATAADALVAVDIAGQAVRDAKARTRDLPHVSVMQCGLPDQLPAGPFDLIVLSEVLYYLDKADLDTATEAVIERLAAGGEVLLVHWLGQTDYPLTGDEAAAGFIRRAGPRLTIVRQTRPGPYRLDHLRRTSGAA